MSETSGDVDPVWQSVPIDEYTVPGDTLSVGKAHKGFRDFLRQFSGNDSRKESPLDPEVDLLSLTGDCLAAAAPAPNWMYAAEAMESRLRHWLDAGSPGKPAVFHVAVPYSGGAEILAAWARAQNIPLVRTPRHQEILGKHEKWFRSWPRDSPWILPSLEKCFIRRADGLDLIRELLSRVLAGDLGRGVIGCDSWGWRFLQHVWLGRPSLTVTTQALDEDAMRQIVSKTIADQEGGRDLSFRNADDGTYLLLPEERSDSGNTSTYFWRRLAEYSRGNIGIALACWQRALRTLPEGDLEDEVSSHSREHRNTIWVTPWNDLELPSYPKGAGESSLFVLHALLLHNGLGVDDLEMILPADRAGVIETLLFLREAELVENNGEVWRVTAVGYPVVRKTLAMNDYLCDQF